MKRILTMIALTCLLSVPALAGDIPCGAPTPGNVPTVSSKAAPGEVPSVGKMIVLTLIALLSR